MLWLPTVHLSLYLGEMLPRMEQELGLCLPDAQVPAVPYGAALCSCSSPTAASGTLCTSGAELSSISHSGCLRAGWNEGSLKLPSDADGPFCARKTDVCDNSKSAWKHPKG